jgi:hypothetical protein
VILLRVKIHALFAVTSASLSLTCAKPAPSTADAEAPSTSVSHAAVPGPHPAAIQVAEAIPTTGTVTVNYEGRTATLGGARARLTGNGLELEFADKPYACSGEPSDATSLSFTVPPGPKHGYFAGKPFGTKFSISAPQKVKDPFALSATTTRVELHPFKAIPGEHVKGTLSGNSLSSTLQTHGKEVFAYAAGGTFDVTICPDQRDAKVKEEIERPDPPSTGPLKVTLSGQPFDARAALAFVWHSKERNVDEVHSIEFFADANVTCRTRTKETESLDVTAFGGAASDAPILNAPQPAELEHDLKKLQSGNVASFSASSIDGQAWVSFDALAFKGGETLSGTVAFATAKSAPTAKEAHGGGRFTATICAMGTL